MARGRRGAWAAAAAGAIAAGLAAAGAAPAALRSARTELALPGGAPVAMTDMLVNVIARANLTDGLELIDGSAQLIAGAWDPEPPAEIATLVSHQTPKAFKIAGDASERTHVNGTVEYAYVDGKVLAFGFVVMDDVAAVETIWSHGTVATTYLTISGKEVVVTVLYDDDPDAPTPPPQ